MDRANPEERPASPSSSRDVGAVAAFFGLTFLLTVPIWLASAVSGLQLMPGLPVAAFAVICPAVAAVVTVWALRGWPRARALLISAADARGIGVGGWLAILLIAPTVGLLSFLILRLCGAAVPIPQGYVQAVLALLPLFLIAAIAEEVGWSGFALNPLQARWGASGAALLIGGVWAVWHYPALLQAHRSATWIAWWTLGTIALRFVIVWLYNGAHGSVFAAAAFHAVSNLAWQLFPVRGSWFDPKINALLMSAVAVCAILGARQLQRRRQLKPERASSPP